MHDSIFDFYHNHLKIAVFIALYHKDIFKVLELHLKVIAKPLRGFKYYLRYPLKVICPYRSPDIGVYAQMGYALKLNALMGDALKLYASKGLCLMTVCPKGTMPYDCMPRREMPFDRMPKYRGAKNI